MFAQRFDSDLLLSLVITAWFVKLPLFFRQNGLSLVFPSVSSISSGNVCRFLSCWNLRNGARDQADQT